MSEPITSPLSLERDGSSQSQRELPGLAPESVGIDEHSLEDWLAFAHAYAQDLNYFRLDNQVGGDWSGFLNPEGRQSEALPEVWREIASFVDNPDLFDDASPHRRPHLVLLLSFLHLLGFSQDRLNRLTRQHLDFYFRQILSLEKQAGQPDRVNVLATLSADTPQALLPAGTLLDAGKDSQGEDLFYRTDEDRVISRAQVKRLYSVFVDKTATGIRQAREAASSSRTEDPLLAMFAIVYGEPTPGDSPPPYPLGQGKPLNPAFLAKLRVLVDFVGASLFMGFAEFRSLMRAKAKREQTASADWRQINGFLEIIGKKKLGEGFAIEPPDSTDFHANLFKALGDKEPDFPSLSGDIASLEDVYALRDKAEIQGFIQTGLGLTLDQFESLMRVKMEVDKDWRIVNTLLELAGQQRRNDPDYRLPGEPASAKFDENFKAALGSVDFSPIQELFHTPSSLGELERLASALQTIEAYFYCSLEDFALLLDAGERENRTDPKQRPKPAEWPRVYSILASAYAKRIYAQRREALDLLRRGGSSLKSTLEDMLRLALGEHSLSASELPNRLDDYRPKDEAGTAAFNAIKALLAGEASAEPDEAGWKAIIETLELAWRKREGAVPVALKQEWRNIYANADAASIKPANLVGTPRWRTFGQRRPARNPSQAPAPLLGWAIASPLFCLSQGQRDLTLTLVFQAEAYDSEKIAALLAGPAPVFLVEATTAEGWVAPSSLKIESGDYSVDKGWLGPDSAKAGQDSLKAFRLSLGFDVSAPAIAALPESESRWPMVRLMLLSVWQGDAQAGDYVTPYPLLQGLALNRVLIEAHVTGLKDLRLENDEGSLPAGKPFEPFGFSPAAGSSLQFTHPELVMKRLDRLDAKLQWMKVPDPKLASHYKNYPVGITANGDFTVNISLVDRRLEIGLADNAALFETDDAAKPHTLGIDAIPQRIGDKRPGYAYLPDFTNFNLKDPSTWPRFWRFELGAKDFQHGNYAKVSAAKSLEFAAAIAAKAAEAASPPPKTPDGKDPPRLPTPNAADYQVNPPYTPKLKSFSVDYGCSLEIVMDTAAPGKGYGSGEERIFYRQAFGHAEIQPEPDTGLYRFLPAYAHEGELYIGLENTRPPQDLTILFQMAEGSANPDLAPQPVEWSYLNGNRWVSLGQGGILADATRGLTGSGIIQFRLPQAEPSTLLPPGLYWLRAAVALDCDSVCDTVALHAQAVSATWVNRNNASEHLNQPLPAGAITKTADSVPGILSLQQPYTSYGGKPGERDGSFNTRASQRLRHKRRALSLWDYEHLILERFPGIHKAKCIPASSTEPSELGKVDIIVIPDIRKQIPFNPFEPKATTGQIAEISEFLASRVPDLAEVRVKNAYYVPVRVRFAVQFTAGSDPGYYKPLLNEELNRFLSPWAYDADTEVCIGGKIYANAIVNFLERRPYVDYVAELKLFKNEDGLEFVLIEDLADEAGYRVQTDRPDGVLVADPQHEIDLITEARFEDAKFTGIGYMKIQLDFIVA